MVALDAGPQTQLVVVTGLMAGAVAVQGVVTVCGQERPQHGSWLLRISWLCRTAPAVTAADLVAVEAAVRVVAADAGWRGHGPHGHGDDISTECHGRSPDPMTVEDSAGAHGCGPTIVCAFVAVSVFVFALFLGQFHL